MKYLDREQWKTVSLIALVLFGILGVPPLLQYFYGIDAVQAAFVIIIIYAAINYWMKRD